MKRKPSRGKFITSNKIIGQKGVNLIEAAVLEMGYAWKPSSDSVESALIEKTSNPPPLPSSPAKVCKKSGVSPYAVRRRFPGLSKRLLANHRRHLRQCAVANRTNRLGRLAELVGELTRQGRPRTRYYLRILMAEKGEKNVFQILRLFERYQGTINLKRSGASCKT